MALPPTAEQTLFDNSFIIVRSFTVLKSFPKGDFFRLFPVPFGYEEKDSYSVVMDFSRFVSPKAGYDPDGWKSQLYPNEIARNS